MWDVALIYFEFANCLKKENLKPIDLFEIRSMGLD